jgi:hypothetical protein
MIRITTFILFLPNNLKFKGRIIKIQAEQTVQYCLLLVFNQTIKLLYHTTCKYKERLTG